MMMMMMMMTKMKTIIIVIVLYCHSVPKIHKDCDDKRFKRDALAAGYVTSRPHSQPTGGLAKNKQTNKQSRRTVNTSTTSHLPKNLLL